MESLLQLGNVTVAAVNVQLDDCSDGIQIFDGCGHERAYAAALLVADRVSGLAVAKIPCRRAFASRHPETLWTLQQYLLLITISTGYSLTVMTATVATAEKDKDLDPATGSVTAPSTPRQTAQRLAPMLKALADEHRLAILLTLAEGPRTVVGLTFEAGIPQTLVSHHLKALRECHLVSVTPVGRSNVYSMCCDAVAEPVKYLAGIAAAAQPANGEGA